jgi:hypothetical protein
MPAAAGKYGRRGNRKSEFSGCVSDVTVVPAVEHRRSGYVRKHCPMRDSSEVGKMQSSVASLTGDRVKRKTRLGVMEGADS